MLTRDEAGNLSCTRITSYRAAIRHFETAFDLSYWHSDHLHHISLSRTCVHPSQFTIEGFLRSVTTHLLVTIPTVYISKFPGTRYEMNFSYYH